MCAISNQATPRRGSAHSSATIFEDLPILWIDGPWEVEVTEERLEDEYARITGTEWNLEKLQFSYWESKIRHYVTQN